VSATLQQSAVNFAAAQAEARRIRRQAARLGVVVSPAGSVSVPLDQDVSQAAVELVDSQVRQAVRAVNDADQRAARAIEELTPTGCPPRELSWMARDQANRALLDRMIAGAGIDAVALLELRERLDDHVLLGVDPLILATGNADSADHVVTIVPGADPRHAFDVLGAVTESARHSDAGTSTAVVWWGGRDPVELTRFLRGVPAGHRALLGHGDGSIVVGEAAKLPGGCGVDDVIVLGGPGMHVSGADEFGVPDGHVWAARATDDPYPHGSHGPDPTSMLFGAKVFDAGTGAYFEPGPALANVGSIVTGRYTSVTPVPWWERLL
jgi:hypothetical protein